MVDDADQNVYGGYKDKNKRGAEQMTSLFHLGSPLVKNR